MSQSLNVGGGRADGPLARRAFQRILLIKPSSLGDVIHALPVLHDLRLRYPTATIDWLISSSFAPLLEDHPDLNATILFDRRRYGRMVTSPRAAGEFLRFVKDLRARSYDLVVDLQGLFRTGFLAFATGAPVRIGFRSAREGASLFYTHAIVCRDANQHAVDRNRSVVAQLGCGDLPPRFPLAIRRAERERARGLLDGLDGAGTSRLVVVAPGARWETKIWPAERFAETIDALQQDDRNRCVLVGGADEADTCEFIAGRCRRRPLNLAGRTDLRALLAVVEMADLVVCLDSGVMHIAAALDRPLVCPTGPTNPRRTGPYGRLADVVRLDLPCSPCYLRRLRQCRFGHECMEQLTSETVVRESRRQLERRPAATA